MTFTFEGDEFKADAVVAIEHRGEFVRIHIWGRGDDEAFEFEYENPGEAQAMRDRARAAWRKALGVPAHPMPTAAELGIT